MRSSMDMGDDDDWETVPQADLEEEPEGEPGEVGGKTPSPHASNGDDEHKDAPGDGPIPPGASSFG